MQIPFDPSPDVKPAGASGVFLSEPERPNAFGAGVAGAVQRAGSTLDTVGAQQTQVAEMFQKQYNETSTDAANTAFEGQVRDTLFGPNGFYSKKGRDAMDSMQPTAATLEGLRTSTRDTLANNEQRRMFDYISRRSASRELYQMQAHATTEFNVWQGETAKGAISNEINNSATYWNDDQRFAQSVGNIKIQAAKLLALKGIDPASEAGQAEITHYTSEAWSGRIRSVMQQDPDVARELFDANSDQMDAAHRAQLDAQIQQHQWTSMMRDEVTQRKADAQAQRELAANQAGNLASLTADTLKGKPLNIGAVSDLVRTQQLSPHAVDFLLSLQKQRSAGPEEDRGDTVIALHKLLNDPSASIDERTGAISDALHHGAIKAATAGTLVDQAYRSDGRAESSTERDAKAAVLAAGGVPDGFINLDHDERQRKAQILTEWQSRMLKGDDPIETRDDMIQRYTPSGVPPATWARPRFGPVTSSADVTAVAAKTKQALASGQITADQARSEGVLLSQYAGFYQRLESARAAAEAAKPKSSSGAKAKVRAVTRTED